MKIYRRQLGPIVKVGDFDLTAILIRLLFPLMLIFTEASAIANREINKKSFAAFLRPLMDGRFFTTCLWVDGHEPGLKTTIRNFAEELGVFGHVRHEDENVNMLKITCQASGIF
jgi:hypothetical protein